MEIKISIESRKEFVRKLADSLFEVWHNSKLYVNTNDENYIIAQCFVQAFILKTQAILKLTEGVRYYSGSETQHQCILFSVPFTNTILCFIACSCKKEKKMHERCWYCCGKSQENQTKSA